MFAMGSMEFEAWPEFVAVELVLALVLVVLVELVVEEEVVEVILIWPFLEALSVMAVVVRKVRFTDDKVW